MPTARAQSPDARQAQTRSKPDLGLVLCHTEHRPGPQESGDYTGQYVFNSGAVYRSALANSSFPSVPLRPSYGQCQAQRAVYDAWENTRLAVHSVQL